MTTSSLERDAKLVKFKLTPSDKPPKPHHGYFTKVAKVIVEEFLKGKQRYATVENIEGIDDVEKLYRLYNAMKSLIRRKKLKIDLNIDRKERKFYLAKEG